MAEGLFSPVGLKRGGRGEAKVGGEITEPERTERPWGKDTAKEWSGVGVGSMVFFKKKERG